jgi:glucose-1-phosphate thymidylyltransferase
VVEEVTVIVGYMAEQVEAYCEGAYGSRLRFNFVHQHDRKGLGHAVLQGRDAVPEGGLMITLGDEIFGMSYSDMLDAHGEAMPCDGSVGYKIVEDPRNYGVLEMDDDGRITAMIEKPPEPTTDTAIAGAYIFEDSARLFEALQEVVDRDIRTRGEYQLTDAMVLMAEKGAVLRGFLIDKWYDCGRPDMLIRVNHRLLEDKPPTDLAHPEAVLDQSVIVPPVAMEGGCVIERSVVGPYVTIGKDTHIRDSVLSDCILAEGCEVRDVVLVETVLADRVVVRGRSHRMVVGEQTLINFE